MLRFTAVALGLMAILLNQGLADDNKVVDKKKFQIQEAAILKFDKETEYSFPKKDTQEHKLIFVVFPPEFSVPINLYAYPQSITIVMREDNKDFTTLSAELAEPIVEFEGRGRYRCQSITIKVPVKDDIERWKKYVEEKYKFISFNTLQKYSPNEYYSHWLIETQEFVGVKVTVPIDKVNLVLKAKTGTEKQIKIIAAVDADDVGIIFYTAQSVTIYAFNQEEYNRIQKDLEETKQKRDAVKQPKRVVPDQP